MNRAPGYAGACAPIAQMGWSNSEYDRLGDFSRNGDGRSVAGPSSVQSVLEHHCTLQLTGMVQKSRMGTEAAAYTPGELLSKLSQFICLPQLTTR